jgi:hypothetical protein
MRDRVTFCIRQFIVHIRPHCCATLVRSIYEQCGDKGSLIHVLDDGRPDLRFSKCCPEEAELVDRLVETEHDIGLSAGRNRLLDIHDLLHNKSRKSCDTWSIAASRGCRSAIRRKQGKPVGTALRSS